MEKDLELLKHIYQEDIYVISELPTSTPDPSGEDGIESGEIEQSPLVHEILPVSFLGNNQKEILILVNDPINDFLSQTELDFLMKIIESGLRYSKNDIALVNTSKFPADQAMDEVSHRFIVSFCSQDSQIDKSIRFYEPATNNEKKILLADPLSEIAGDRSKKMLLWKALKSMFDIKH